MPGSFKNLLDWTVGGGETYEMPVAWVNTSPRGATLTHESLRHVLGYTHSDIVEGACAQVPVTRDAVGADGLVDDPRVRAALAASLTALAARVAERA
jgi:NAD(P)H-dependent FMN reductase